MTQAISAITELGPWDPYWVEEPTSPDEILGLAAIRAAIAPIKVAAGEHVANRVIFKQFSRRTRWTSSLSTPAG